MNARSIAYLTSFAVISRLTGGANLTPFRSFTVTVFLSSEISRLALGEVGHGLSSSGLKA